ncbi:hypothetical protein ACQEU5_06405 [Marinactinospora thermotolerans]|nr:hypothetical protein [Marinactinospora thermotolerans]
MSSETYMKRRVFVLAGILLIVALIAYACSASPSDDGERAAGVSPDPGTGASPDSSASPSIAASPSTGAGSEDGDPAGDEDAGGSEGAAGEGGEGSGGGAGGPGAAAPAGGGDGGAAPDIPAPQRSEDPCRPQDVVVTLATDRTDYAWDAQPKIEVTVVNTAEQTCTIDVGPKAMELRITSGEDRIFSTADCVEGRGTDNEQLRRGVPLTTTVTWERERSWPDCREADSQARPGTYVVTLYGDYVNGAEPQVFRLN